MKKNRKIKKNKFFKPNYFVIPIITILVSLIGGYFTDLGMDWYKMLATPAWTPPGAVIGIVWTIIYILTTISALIAWNGFKREKVFQWIIALFVIILAAAEAAIALAIVLNIYKTFTHVNIDEIEGLKE